MDRQPWFGCPAYAVIDAEAVILKKRKPIYLMEQIGFVVVDFDGNELLAEKHLLYQYLSIDDMMSRFGVSRREAQKGIDGYLKVTGDRDYMHTAPGQYEKWFDVRERIASICLTAATAVFAKGMALEDTVFYNRLPFMDLEEWGVPKYPHKIHDPLLECKFFSKFIPLVLTNTPIPDFRPNLS